MRLAALLLAVACTPASAQPERIEIASESLPVAGVTTSEGLRATGAWRLTAAHRGFGGFSGLLMVDDELLMLSDAGWLVRWRRDRDEASIAPLPPACRQGTGKHAADAEAIALTPDGLELRVALERETRLCGFALGETSDSRELALDRALPGGGNDGVEAMATLPRRGTLLIAETANDGAHDLLWFDERSRRSAPALMHYRPPHGYKPADAAFHPDGRLLIVNRRFDIGEGRASSLTLADFAPAQSGQVGGAEIARIANSALAANFEGIALQPTARGVTIWLVSDDNFSSGKGTLLLRLELDDAILASAGSAAMPVSARK